MNNFKNGYIDCFMDEVTECRYGHPIIMTTMPSRDFHTLKKISDSTDFYDAMIKLHDDDIIEYELKMSQFRSQVEAQEAEEERKKAEESNHVVRNADLHQSQLLIRGIHFSLDSLVPASL